MSQTSDHPLFPTILESIRKVVTTIEYGLQFNESKVELTTPLEGDVIIPRSRWINELNAALSFFQEFEYYEDCALTLPLIERLNNEPTVEQMLHNLKSKSNDDSDS